MFSLRKHINRIDDLESLFRESLASLRAVVESVAEHAPRATRELLEEHRKHLKKLSGELTSAPSCEVLTGARDRLDQELKLYGKKVDQHIRRQERDAKEIMAIVAMMAESMASREKKYGVRFRGIARNLNLLATATDLAEIRRKLGEQVAQMDQYVDDMQRDTQDAVARLQQEMPKRGLGPCAEEGSDAVTSLLGRKEAQALIEARTKIGLRFCVAHFFLRRFPEIGETWGPGAAEAVLREFARRLLELFRSSDVVCRWGEDEFVAIADARLPELAGRAAEMEKRLSGTYLVVVRGERLQIQVACGLGIAEHIPPETADQMLARVQDQMGRLRMTSSA